MTIAPPALLAARKWIIDHWNIDPEKVGIVGDPKHFGGYHCGEDRVVHNDYSVVESTRDIRGLSAYASALDIGTFNNGPMNLQHFSRWLVAQCKAKTPETGNIREVIYSPDGKVVKRWDRLGRRTTGDDTHLWHTHISIFRDASNADLVKLFKLYTEEMLMDYTDDRVKNPRQRGDSDTNPTVQLGFYFDDSYQKLYDFRDALNTLNAKVDALALKVEEMKAPVYFQLTDEQFQEYLNRVDNGE